MLSELDLRSLWKELDAYEKELEKENKTLGDVWAKIAQIQSKYEDDAKLMILKEEFNFLEPEVHVKLNIGGQLFETTAGILTRDPYSLLAACCRVKDCPIPKIDEQNFYFDRDWWLFRHILSYLRSSILPNELETLKELYAEASYYRLESLQKSIENMPIEQVSNLTPQISVTWPGAAGRIQHEQAQGLSTRPEESYAFNQSLFNV
jgi:hypothetical protein